jgi:hypothetical protein
MKPEVSASENRRVAEKFSGISENLIDMKT